jgi:hypothetical protein
MYFLVSLLFDWFGRRRGAWFSFGILFMGSLLGILGNSYWVLMVSQALTIMGNLFFLVWLCLNFNYKEVIFTGFFCIFMEMKL